MIDVTPEGAKHQRVFSVGLEILGEKSRTVLPNLDMYKTAHESFFTNELDQETKAFSFILRKPGNNTNHDKISSPLSLGQSRIYSTEKDCPMIMTLKMASLCYTHSPRILHELSECLSGFREFMTPVASSIKDVATEVALGIVGKKTESSGFSMHGSALSLPNVSIGKVQREASFDDITDSFIVKDEENSRDKLSIVIDVMLESPVIVIPRTPTSSEVLVTHLGQISVRNSDIPMNESAMEDELNFEQNTDKIYIGVKNMNLYSVDVDTHLDRDYLNKSFSHSDVFAKQECGVPILHNTSIEIMLTQTDHEYTIINPDCSENLLLDADISGRFGNDTVEVVDNPSVIQVEAKISTPLKLVLSKDVYEQLLQTVDNLTYDPHNYPGMNNACRTTKSETSSDANKDTDVKSSVSALKMEEDKTFNKTFLSSKQLEKAKAISDSMTLKLNFQVPLFNVEMRGDFGEGEQGLVDLKLYDFIMEYEKDNPHTTKLELYLKSLIMEDLLESPDSAHRHLMLSKDVKSEKSEEPKLFLSRSCPDSTIITPVPVMPPSLPSSFQDKTAQNYIPSYLGNMGRQAHPEWRLGVPVSK